MLLLAILLPGVSMLLNGRIISGMIAIILQVIAFLTFLVFGIGFLLWLILVFWAISVRNKAKTERSLKNLENKFNAKISTFENLNKQAEVVIENKAVPKVVPEKPKVVPEKPKVISEKPKEKKESPIVPIKNFISKNKLAILKFGIPIILLSVLFKIVYTLIMPEFSDPLNVVERTEKLWRKNDWKAYYNCLTEKSQQTYKSFDDFISKRSIPDSIFKKMEPISISINEIKMTGFNEFKRFKITAIDKDDIKIDTNTYYRTLFNESGKWKLVWNKELINQGNDFFQKGDFKKAAEIYNTAIELDPFSITARTLLVWCYIRDTARPLYWEDTTIYHLNFVLKLDTTDGEIYNAIGAYYSNVKNDKKAVNNFLLAAKYYKDSSSIANAYSNASQNAKSFDVSKAEHYIEKSLDLNKNSSFAWQTFGDLLYKNQKFIGAKEKYLKAIELALSDKNIDNHTLISLYGNYALTCKKLGLKDEAEEYILKCIRVYPDKKHPIFKELNL